MAKVKHLAEKGHTLRILVIDWDKRTIPQNSYYWGVVLDTLSKHTGHTPEELHDMARYQFHFKLYRVKGEEVRIPQSTTGLSKKSMAIYLEQVIAWANQLGCRIPSPDELSEAAYYEALEATL